MTRNYTRKLVDFENAHYFLTMNIKTVQKACAD